MRLAIAPVRAAVFLSAGWNPSQVGAQKCGSGNTQCSHRHFEFQPQPFSRPPVPDDYDGPSLDQPDSSFTGAGELDAMENLMLFMGLEGSKQVSPLAV